MSRQKGGDSLARQTPANAPPTPLPPPSLLCLTKGHAILSHWGVLLTGGMAACLGYIKFIGVENSSSVPHSYRASATAGSLVSRFLRCWISARQAHKLCCVRVGAPDLDWFFPRLTVHSLQKFAISPTLVHALGSLHRTEAQVVRQLGGLHAVLAVFVCCRWH